MVLEDDWLTYGVGAEIAATIQEGAFDYLDAPVRRVAAAEVPLPYAKPLELAALPDAGALAKVIGEVLDATRVLPFNDVAAVRAAFDTAEPPASE